MSVLKINDAEIFKAALRKAGDKLVVVDFYAEWCGPCQQIAPHVHRFSESYKEQAIFIKVEVEESPDIMDTYNVSSLPTFVFIKSRAEIDRFSGNSISELEEKITQHLSSSLNLPDKLKTTLEGMSMPSNLLLSNFFGASGHKDESFGGEGHRLGDKKTPEEGESSKGWFSKIADWFPSSSSAPGEQSMKDVQAEMGVDENLPHAPIQIRLIDATKIKLVLNLTHPVSKIREFIIKSRPNFAKTPFVLVNSFSRKEIIDETVSVQEANLAHSLVIQSQKLVISS